MKLLDDFLYSKYYNWTIFAILFVITPLTIQLKKIDLAEALFYTGLFLFVIKITYINIVFKKELDEKMKNIYKDDEK